MLETVQDLILISPPRGVYTKVVNLPAIELV